jgi:2-dehydropantoate 2-reductase
MNVVVIGGGSMGLVYAGMLSTVTETSLLVRRAEQSSLINEKGVEISTTEGTKTYRLSASTDPTKLRLANVALALVKSYDTETVAKTFTENAGPDTLLVTLQSGVGPLEIYNLKAGSNRVIAGVSYLGARRISDRIVELGGNMRTVLGEQEGPVSARIRDLVDLLCKAGISGEASDNVVRLIWEKMVVISAQHAVGALTGRTFGELLESPETTKLIAHILDELREVAEAIGVQLPGRLVERVHENWKSLPHHHPSMWQDLQAGRPTEIDVINGAIVRIGDEKNIQTPTNSTVTSLVRIAEGR